MVDQEQTIQQLEEEASKGLEPHLREHLQVVQQGYNLVGIVGSKVPASPMDMTLLPLVVTSNLLVRLANDLRCMADLAQKGYPLQALTLASSIYEVAFTIAFIGTDQKLAQEWADHEDPTRSFRPAFELTKGGLEKLGVGDLDNQANRDYKVYRQFCWGKHSNPLLQSRFGFEKIGRGVAVTNAPDTSEFSIKTIWFLIDYSIRFACIALASFSENHLREDALNDVRGEIVKLVEARNGLNRNALARWGNEDPFPGKW